MDKIVSLCRRRGFVFPSSEIYGGLGSTYDYGHYGVLAKNNIRSLWFESMVQERDDIVALDSAIILNPRVWEASGHVGGFTRSARRLPHLQAPLPRRQARRRAVRPQAEQAPRRVLRVRPDRGAAVQPDVPDARRRARGRGLARVPPAGDRAGHLRQLQERAADRAAQAAVRDRAGRQVVPQRDHAGQLPLPHARVRADGDGVLRPAGGGRAVVPATGSTRGTPGTRPRPAREPPAQARARRGRALALLERDDRPRVPLPDRLVGARGHRQPRRLRPDAAHASTPERSSSTSARTASATRRT